MPAQQSDWSAPGRTPVVGTDLESRVLRLEDENLTLKEAVRTRTLIGTAIGLLAERYRCTTQEAWALVTRVSSHTNIKAREVARVVVRFADGSHDAGDRVLLETLAPHLPGLVREPAGRVAVSMPAPPAGSTEREGTTS
jgi:hypothetical protein